MWYLLVYAVHRFHEQCGRPPTAQDVSGLLRGALCLPDSAEEELRKLADLGYVEERDGRYVATETGIGAVVALMALSNCVRAYAECVDGAIKRLCARKGGR